MEERSREESVVIARNHKVLMDGRKKCGITGVVDVISFDPGEVVLKTSLGMLTIKGQELKVTRLSVDKGEVDITGRTDSMVYCDGSGGGRKQENFAAKLFR